jgi:hypothetical protein
MRRYFVPDRWHRNIKIQVAEASARSRDAEVCVIRPRCSGASHTSPVNSNRTDMVTSSDECSCMRAAPAGTQSDDRPATRLSFSKPERYALAVEYARQVGPRHSAHTAAVRSDQCQCHTADSCCNLYLELTKACTIVTAASRVSEFATERICRSWRNPDRQMK